MSKTIETESEYESALVRIYELMDAKPDSVEEKELSGLASMVEKYEDEHYPISSPEVAE